MEAGGSPHGRIVFLLLYVISTPHLQRELWLLGGFLQVLLGLDYLYLSVVGLQHHGIPLLGIAIGWHIVGVALWDVV